MKNLCKVKSLWIIQLVHSVNDSPDWFKPVSLLITSYFFLNDSFKELDHKSLLLVNRSTLVELYVLGAVHSVCFFLAHHIQLIINIHNRVQKDTQALGESFNHYLTMVSLCSSSSCLLLLTLRVGLFVVLWLLCGICPQGEP